MPNDPLSFDLILELNRCSNVYGQAPCTASRGPGFECYNCFATCQDKPNYVKTTDTLRLMADRAIPFAADVDGFPCLSRDPAITSAEIRRGQGLAVRGGCTVYARDFVTKDTPPIGLDPYWATRDNRGMGTFFPRLRALYPYLQDSIALLEYYSWGMDGTRTITSTREYVFDTIDGPNAAGDVSIKLTDLLSVGGEGSVLTVPRVSNDTLTANISLNDTIIPITTDAPQNWRVTNGEFTCEDEIIGYTAFNGVQATGCVRGLYETDNKKHDAGDIVRSVQIYDGVNVVDVLYDLLTVFGGIDPRHIPYNNDPGNPDEWDIEKELYLAGHTITHRLGEPVLVEKALRQLCSQCYIHMWYEPTTSKIRLAATNVRLAEYDATPIDEQNDILAGSLTVKEKRLGTVTQSWTYYDKYRFTDAQAPQNFASLIVSVNTELESPNAFGSTRTVARLANWLTGAGNIALTTNSRTLIENNAPRYEITFQTDTNNSILVGQFVLMRVAAIQRADGSSEDLSCQVVKAKEVIPGARTQYTVTILRALDPDFVPRFANIVNLANESVEYGDATELARGLWGWIASIDGFSNGDDPYNIL